MAFLKTCYECGAKTEKLYDGKCEMCYKDESPPIVEVKPVNVKFCNICKKIHYQNQLISQKDLIGKLPDIVRKNIVIDEHYKLNELALRNVKINGEKISFDIDVDCSLK